MSRFAPRPTPPYYAVIFTSQRTEGDDGYGSMAQRMSDLVKDQPGFLGVESARDATGLGITVAYFQTDADIVAWRRHIEHKAARDGGRARWYSHYEVRVARVERAYGWDRAEAERHQDAPRD